MLNLKKVWSSATLWSMLYNGFRVGNGLLVLPLALRTMPKEVMGLYYTFLAIGSIATLADFGLGTTVGRNAAYAMAGADSFSAHGLGNPGSTGAPNIGLLAGLVKAVRIWYYCLGAVILILLLTAGSGYLNHEIAKAHLAKSYEWAWVLFAIGITHAFATGFWNNLLMGINEVRLSAQLGVLGQAVNIAILVVGLSSGWTIWSYGIASLFSGIVSRTIAEHAFIKRSGISEEFRRKPADLDILKTLWPMSWRLGIMLIASFFIQRANTLICSSKFGLAETASYGTTLNIITIIFQMSTTPLIVIYPKITHMRLSNNIKGIRELFFGRLMISMAMGVCGVLVLAFFGPAAFHLIGSKTQLLSFQLIMLMGSMLLLDNHQGAYFNLVLTENKNPFVLPWCLCGILTLILCWWFAGLWGITGMIWGQVGVLLFITNTLFVWHGFKNLALPSRTLKVHP